MIQLLSVLIPAYNEERTIKHILEYVIEVKLIEHIKKEIVVVDDASKDKTVEIVQNVIKKYPDQKIKLILQEKNQGKGAAIQRAIQECTGDYLIIQDADLEYDPEEYNLLIKPVLKDNADVVFGSRFIGHHPHRILFYWHSKGNRFLTNLSNMMTNLNLTDMETCYKLMRSSIAKKINIKEKRFGIEPEITAKLAKVPHIKIYEVGISYYGRTYEEGKKIGWKDGFRALWCIVKYRFVD
ncbi:MAG: glycosyltransferase family 2 protein [Flavobacteriia bacterium]|nr:glycosyltransferase family 2 protein [Flavobacteriia bacterium]